MKWEKERQEYRELMSQESKEAEDIQENHDQHALKEVQQDHEEANCKVVKICC